MIKCVCSPSSAADESCIATAKQEPILTIIIPYFILLGFKSY